MLATLVHPQARNSLRSTARTAARVVDRSGLVNDRQTPGHRRTRAVGPDGQLLRRTATAHHRYSRVCDRLGPLPALDHHLNVSVHFRPRPPAHRRLHPRRRAINRVIPGLKDNDRLAAPLRRRPILERPAAYELLDATSIPARNCWFPRRVRAHLNGRRRRHHVLPGTPPAAARDRHPGYPARQYRGHEPFTRRPVALRHMIRSCPHRRPWH